jgi:flagellar basal-body rod protein FlgC
MNGLFRIMNISGSGLLAEAKRMEVISHNIANANTISEDGVPYTRKYATFQDVYALTKDGTVGAGIKHTGVYEDDTPYTRVYDPESPYSDEDGYVLMPNVDIMTEMTELLITNRSYSSNAQAFTTSKQLYNKALEIGK